MSAVPEPITFPTTFNDHDNVFALIYILTFIIVVSETNNDNLNVTL